MFYTSSSPFIALARTSNTMWNRSGKDGNPCLVSGFMMCLGVIFFEFILEFVELHRCIDSCFSSILEHFRHVFFKYTFCPLLFLFLSFWDSLCICWYAHRSLKLCEFFFILFFLSVPHSGQSQLTFLQFWGFFFLPAQICR